MLICITSFAQEKDTVPVAFNEVLIVGDDLYYGVNDSIVLIDSGVDYRLTRNFLVRKPAYYKRKPHKKESVRRLHNKYVHFLLGQIRTKKEDLPEDFNPSDSYYSFYKDHIIKDISVDGVAVLDGNVFDTTKVNLSGLGRFLNKTYHPTREKVVRKNLTFQTGQKLNPRVLSDNERILRNLSYIEDAKIKIIPVEGSGDSVNVLVLTKDRYPVGIGGDVNDYNHFEVEPYTRNFLGYGHSTGMVFQYKGDADDWFGYGAYYETDNIAGKFINSEIRFNRGVDNDLFRIQLEKPFLTANTRFGGEVRYESLKERIEERKDVIDTLYPDYSKYSRDMIDIWSGYSFLFDNDPSRPFLNVAGRFYLENYKEKPEEWFEFNYPFHDKNLYLVSVSLQKVSYIKTSKLLQFGTIEDVPIGYNLNATTGWEHTSFFDRPYMGVRINYSAFRQNAGIFSAELDVGTYLYKNDLEDAVTGIQFNYLSPLGNLGKFEWRNIFEISYTSLHNPRYLLPVVFINYELEMGEYGYLGDANIELSYHPVFYSPNKLAGFSFSFNPFLDLGWLRAPDAEGRAWDHYSMIGITASIKNESLIFPAMHLHMGYYINELKNESRFEFKVIFKDLKIFNEFTSLKPRVAHPANFR